MEALTTPVEMFTLLPKAFTFNGNLAGSLPATVCTGLLRESKFELETYSGRMWNCNSSIFWPSLRELRKPALRFEKAASSGARIVKPPLLAVMSCELMLFIISVVFSNRISTENILAFLRILVMSSGTESEESGTNGFGDSAAALGVEGVFAGAFGAGAGEMAKVVEENSRKSEKEKKAACFIFQDLMVYVNVSRVTAAESSSAFGTAGPSADFFLDALVFSGAGAGAGVLATKKSRGRSTLST
ncbi:hypothetical protein Lal_00035171 [Lupinus albus]|nr:hypothetical protein Lal_00035171 [Lupinus albus]